MVWLPPTQRTHPLFLPCLPLAPLSDPTQPSMHPPLPICARDHQRTPHLNFASNASVTHQPPTVTLSSTPSLATATTTSNTSVTATPVSPTPLYRPQLQRPPRFRFHFHSFPLSPLSPAPMCPAPCLQCHILVLRVPYSGFPEIAVHEQLVRDEIFQEE